MERDVAVVDQPFRRLDLDPPIALSVQHGRRKGNRERRIADIADGGVRHRERHDQFPGTVRLLAVHLEGLGGQQGRIRFMVIPHAADRLPHMNDDSGAVAVDGTIINDIIVGPRLQPRPLPVFCIGVFVDGARVYVVVPEREAVTDAVIGQIIPVHRHGDLIAYGEAASVDPEESGVLVGSGAYTGFGY